MPSCSLGVALTASGRPYSKSSDSDRGPADTPLWAGGPRVLVLSDGFVLASSYGVVGTLISPEMIFSLNASSWSVMSSIFPPLVA